MSDSTRREFLQMIAALTAGVGTAGLAPALARQPAEVFSPAAGTDPHVGIQMQPQSLVYEGIERVMDMLQEKAAVNTLYVSSHAFHSFGMAKDPEDLATHFGLPKRDFRGKIPLVWVDHHDKYFRNTRLRVKQTDPSLKYADRDLFKELVEPAKKRDMKVYARMYEQHGDQIENFDLVRTEKWDGKRGTTACWRHPDYRNFWRSLVGDMFRHYELDGMQWGAERHGPLMNIVMPWRDKTEALCFCEYCTANAARKGIDVDRAKEGWLKLYEYVQRLVNEDYNPPEGVTTVLLRHLIQYPEILAWEYQYRLGREQIKRDMYETIKSIKSDADVGWHISHQQSSWDMAYRAELSYKDTAPYSDFIKLILYHEALGPRLRDWIFPVLKKSTMKEFSMEEILGMYYDIFGYDENIEPSVENLGEGFSPNYVYQETKRSVASAGGEADIYSGIGIDIGGTSAPSDPQSIYQATKKGFEGGAAGIVISRSYDEIKLPHLEPIGRAVRDWKS